MSEFALIPGAKVYLVGGAVRDSLLELPVSERDWVVVGATEETMLKSGFERADGIFPVFLHPRTGEEYALARTEIKSGPGYKGFEVDAGPEITLEQDLRRRDLTINALARDESGTIIDICSGREDLDQGLLRHITPAFVEDPVRLLRIARFAAKLGKWGFRVAHGTHGLMRKMAQSPDLQTLTAERLHREMRKALAEPQPWRFFEVLQGCAALQGLLPEMAQLMADVAGHGSSREADVMVALKRVTRLSDSQEVRFAVVVYASMASGIELLGHLRPTRLEQERVDDLLALAPLLLQEGSADSLLRVVQRLKPERSPQRLTDFTDACRALWPEPASGWCNGLALARQAVSEVDVASLRSQGLEGKALGEALRSQRHSLLENLLQASTGLKSC
jgi:tRNA nucleotidyltransferase (CCA-adding enzyme)